MLGPTTLFLCRRALFTPRITPAAFPTHSFACLSAARPFSFSSLLQNGAPSTSASPATSIPASASTTASTTASTSTNASITTSNPSKVYHGPLSASYRRVKLVSLTTLGVSFSLAPSLFLFESNLPLSARLALVSICIGSSAISTALVGWCGRPYVTTLKYLPTPDGAGAPSLEMTTFTWALKPRVTKVYDPYFLVETQRPLATWELASKIALPPNKDSSALAGLEETVAETLDKDGQVIGRWIVKWDENGEGTCRQVGNVVRHFNVHQELLNA